MTQTERSTKNQRFQINVRVCMEVMATCLDKLMKDRLKNKPFRQDVVGKVVVSVLDALSYLKNKHVRSTTYNTKKPFPLESNSQRCETIKYSNEL